MGNGLTGIMIYGSLKKERLCFNDGTLWSGYPKDYNSKDSLDNLERVRKLIFEGRNAEADALCEEKLTGFYSEAFMPLGEISLKFSGIDKDCYSRSLDLSNAVHTVKTKSCTSEAFSIFLSRNTRQAMTRAKDFGADEWKRNAPLLLLTKCLKLCLSSAQQRAVL